MVAPRVILLIWEPVREENVESTLFSDLGYIGQGKQLPPSEAVVSGADQVIQLLAIVALDGPWRKDFWVVELNHLFIK